RRCKQPAPRGSRAAKEPVKPRRASLFSGLVKDAHNGATYYVQTRREGAGGANYSVLQSAGCSTGSTPCRAFPLETFERALLSRLREIKPHDILNGDRPPDETTALRTAFEGVEAELAQVKAFMADRGFSVALGERVVALEGRQ